MVSFSARWQLMLIVVQEGTCCPEPSGAEALTILFPREGFSPSSLRQPLASLLASLAPLRCLTDVVPQKMLTPKARFRGTLLRRRSSGSSHLAQVKSRPPVCLWQAESLLHKKLAPKCRTTRTACRENINDVLRNRSSSAVIRHHLFITVLIAIAEITINIL